jgi:hypothetical protein
MTKLSRLGKYSFAENMVLGMRNIAVQVKFNGDVYRASAIFNYENPTILVSGSKNKQVSESFPIPVDQGVLELLKEERNVYLLLVMLVIGVFGGIIPERLGMDSFERLLAEANRSTGNAEIIYEDVNEPAKDILLC